MFKKLTLLIIVCSVVVLTGCGSNPSTPAGSEGYVFENPRMFGEGGFRGTLKGPQNFGVSVFCRNEIINIDMRPNTYRENFNILANDDLNISVGFHAVLSLKSGTVKDVVENLGGEQWYRRFVQKTYRTYVREAVQGYDSKGIKENRDSIATTVRTRLRDYLKETPVVVKSVVVGNIDYPEAVAQAVEKKLAAQQQLEAKETERQIARKDAEIKIEEARGIAEAQRIINTTLTVNYLQHEAINAQLKMAESPNHTTVYIPSGSNGIPLVGNIK